MKLLTMYTCSYSQLLENFALSAMASGWISTYKSGWEGSVFFVSCRYSHAQPAFVKGLMALVAEITVWENPVYQHSPKLQGMAHDLSKTPLYDAELKCLTRFLKHSQQLHLEGYATFRMADYREKLDMMSYTLIKKLKLNQQD